MSKGQASVLAQVENKTVTLAETNQGAINSVPTEGSSSLNTARVVIGVDDSGNNTVSSNVPLTYTTGGGTTMATSAQTIPANTLVTLAVVNKSESLNQIEVVSSVPEMKLNRGPSAVVAYDVTPDSAPVIVPTFRDGIPRFDNISRDPLEGKPASTVRPTVIINFGY